MALTHYKTAKLVYMQEIKLHAKVIHFWISRTMTSTNKNVINAPLIRSWQMCSDWFIDWYNSSGKTESVMNINAPWQQELLFQIASTETTT